MLIRTGNWFRHTQCMAAAVFWILSANPAAADSNLLTAPESQPQNVGDAIRAATTYHESGAYMADVTAITAKASAWIIQRAPQVSRPAVVFDIDETALTNWEVIVRDNFGRPVNGPCDLSIDGPCGWAAWDNLAKDAAIEPTLGVYKSALEAKAAVFFITGRPESQRAATEKNLKAEGYNSFITLFMVPDGTKYASAVDFKAPVRAEIEKGGYTIIANIGDQPSDLLGGYAERIFLLPNPFYRVP